MWDDCDGERRLNAGAFVNRMSVIRVRRRAAAAAAAAAAAGGGAAAAGGGARRRRRAAGAAAAAGGGARGDGGARRGRRAGRARAAPSPPLLHPTPTPTPRAPPQYAEQLRVAKLSLAGRGERWWSKLSCKRGPAYGELTVHMRVAPLDPLAPVDVRFRLGGGGGALPGSPAYELQPDAGARDVVLEVANGYGVVARCARGGGGRLRGRGG